MLLARLHPYPADTSLERKYTGLYANRATTMEGGEFFYTGANGKKQSWCNCQQTLLSLWTWIT